VSVRRSVQRDAVIRLECGWKGKVLRRHLAARHELSPKGYRSAGHLLADHPLTAPSYSGKRSALASATALGQTRKTTKAVRPTQRDDPGAP